MLSVPSILIAAGILVAFTPAQAIYRPGYGGGNHRPPSSYHHGGGEEDCKTSTVPPTTPTTTTTVRTTPSTSTTPRTKACPTGWFGFARSQSSIDSKTHSWCMRVSYSKEPILISNGTNICKALHPESAPTMYQSDNEKRTMAISMRTNFNAMGITNGAIGVDGRRKPACVSKDRAVVEGPNCTGDKAFQLIGQDTDPAYAWTTWAATEPSANAWTYDVEECIQFALGPAERHELLNDIYCNMAKPPNDPDNTLYWNFGMLCGMSPI